MTPASHPVSGVLWMLASGLAFVVMTVLVRHMGNAIPAPQAGFLRCGFGLLILLPFLIEALANGLPRRTLPLFLGRGVVHTAAVILWFYGLARVPVAEVTAIGYLNPVLVTLGAALFLGERLTPARLLAIAVATLGALVILRPGLRALGAGEIAQVGASACFAASYLFAKRLSLSVPPAAIVAMMALTVTLGLMPLALWVWVPVTGAQVGMLVMVAVCSTAGHYCMTRAFAAAPLAVTQPVTFLQLVWATLLGAGALGEAVDIWVLAGGALIMAAISYITWREAVSRPRPAVAFGGRATPAVAWEPGRPPVQWQKTKREKA